MSYHPFDLHRGVLEIFSEAMARRDGWRWNYATMKASQPHGFRVYDADLHEQSNREWNQKHPGAAAARTKKHKFERIIVFHGVAKTVLQWAVERGMSPWTLSKRLERGWGPWRALHEPVRSATGAAALEEAAE